MTVNNVLLSPLIEKARREGLWLRCSYQDLWFSPDELEVENRQGRFLWGEINWKLRDPQENIVALKQRVTSAQCNLVDFQNRVVQNTRNG